MEGCTYHVALCIIALQMSFLNSQQPSPEESPAELGARLLEKSCNADNFTAFYLHIREEQGMTRRFPSWPSDDSARTIPASIIYWASTSPHYEPYPDIFPAYEEFWSDIFSLSAGPNDYTWCVHVFSEDTDVHGCIVGNGTSSWATPDFERLGLLEKLSTRDVGPEFGLPYPIMALSIDAIGVDEYPFGNLLWHNAMVTVNIGWRDPSDYVSSVGEYLIISVNREKAQYITGISRQSDAFLVEGRRSEFYCETHGAYKLFSSGWRGAENTLLQFLTNDKQCNDEDRQIPCEDVHYTSSLLTTGNCEELNSDVFILGTNRFALLFLNSTINDTGEYACFIKNRDSDPQNQLDHQTRSIFVYVVFVEVFGNGLPYDQEGELRCTVKAPTNSTITVQHNRKTITTPYNAEQFYKNCDHLPQISTSAQALDDEFSLLSVIIHVCHVLIENVGTYQCKVEYSIPTDSEAHFSRASTDVTTVQTVYDEAPESSRLSKGMGVTIGCLVFLLCSILVAVLSIFLCLFVIKTRRPPITPDNLPLIFRPRYSRTLGPSTPEEGSLNHMEISRNLLRLHQEIGKGRFGRVMLASPSLPTPPHLPILNKVAVKMALSNSAQSNALMLDEVNIMKQLDSHKNICNLIAYCTVDGPVCVVMEYAQHGNLKEYLDQYRQAILQSGQSLFICNTSTGAFRAGGLEWNKTPGLLSEIDVRESAFQIACGLEHLQAMKVVHCDLAARNILISEGFVLKIGDFGMSRKTTEEENYHNITDLDGIIAVKWAPLEVLENKGYFFESDVWSYAVTIWEMASYGIRPFSDRKIGVSLNQFVQFLRAGNRLPQPNALSDSIYQILLRCWSEEMSARPSPTTLKLFFQDYND